MQDVLVQENGVQMDVVKFNVTDSEIAKMKEDFMALTINGVDDKVGFKKVYESRQQVKKIRVGIVKYATELKEQAIAWQKKVNSEKDRVVGELTTIEDYLQSQEDIIAKEKEQIKAEQDRKAQEALQSRVDQLSKYAAHIDITFLKSISDDAFVNVLDNARIEFEAAEATRIEQERVKKNAEDALKIEQQKLDAARLEMEKQQADLKRQQDELARQKKDTEDARIKAEKDRKDAEFKSRITDLARLDLAYSFRESGYRYADSFVSEEMIESLSFEEWQSLLDDITPKVNLVKEEQRKASELKRDKDSRFEKRKTQLLSIGFEYELRREYNFILEGIWSCFQEQVYNPEENEWDEYLAAINDAIRAHAEKETARREALRPDKDKLLAFASKIDSFIDFAVNSNEAKTILNQCTVRLNAMKNYITEKANEL